MKASSGASRVAVIDRVHQALESLGLAEMNGVVESRLEQAAREEQAYGDFLAELLDCEVGARRERYLRTRMRLAHFPALKTLELRARRDASRQNTAPTSPSQTCPTRLRKPGRSTVPLAERPRSSSITRTS